MLSMMWRKAKDSVSSERSTVLERISDTNNFRKIMQSEEDSFSCNHYQHSYTFLNSCHLCLKPLNGKDIYMYRGEIGFCSSECRERQMYLDDMKKIEISTKRILASFRARRHSGSRCDSRGGGERVAPPAAAAPIFLST